MSTEDPPNNNRRGSGSGGPAASNSSADPSVTSTGTRKLEGHRHVAETSFDFEDWKIIVLKSPMLPSNCYCDMLDENNTRGLCLETGCTFQDGTGGEVTKIKCQVCRYTEELNLKHLPEMVFPDNVLHLWHKTSGLVLEFNTLDAMKLMTTKEANTYHVAVADAWQTSKAEMGLPKDVLHDFNWTFTTDYRGTLKQRESDGLIKPEGSEESMLKMERTSSDKLNIQKLMQKEKILFYEELTLFEDELHDNGISNCSVKIRVMPSGFFILLRCFLRVDHVMAKIVDTRLHYEKENNYFLRQYQVREESFKKLGNLEPHIFKDINVLYNHLPIKNEVTDKIFVS